MAKSTRARDTGVECKGGCGATVPDAADETLAAAHWGWKLAPDPGLGSDAHGVLPGWFYACPNCSDARSEGGAE
jgi:hypothetical protein